MSLFSQHPTFFFFFNDTATTEIYTLSLHDALPISPRRGSGRARPVTSTPCARRRSWRCAARYSQRRPRDRKSTRLNSSHGYISYAVFCLKKKKKKAMTIEKTVMIGRGENSTDDSVH